MVHWVFSSLPMRARPPSPCGTCTSSNGLLNHTNLQRSFRFLDPQITPLDSATFAQFLQACGKLAALTDGKHLHAQIIRSGLGANAFLAHHLIDMYGKCGSIQDSRKVFDVMLQRTVISWTVMIAVCVQQQNVQEAFSLFRKMPLECVIPNRVTFITLLRACTTSSSLDEVKMMHACVFQSGVEMDVVLGNAFVSTYAKCGSLDCAHEIFTSMQERNVVSWTAMIGAYAQLGESTEALRLFQQMQEEGVQPNEVTIVSVLSACRDLVHLTDGKELHFQIRERGFESQDVVACALLTMYGKCGGLEDACNMYDKMHIKSVVLWNAMIATYCHHACSIQAIHAFKQMQVAGVIPNKNTFITVLNACDDAAALADGRVIHGYIVEGG